MGESVMMGAEGREGEGEGCYRGMMGEVVVVVVVVVGAEAGVVAGVEAEVGCI